MDRTDYECRLRLSIYRISRMAQDELGLVHLTPQLDRDLQVCLESLGVERLLVYRSVGEAGRTVSVDFEPKPGTSREQFNELTVRLKAKLGAAWWE